MGAAAPSIHLDPSTDWLYLNAMALREILVIPNKKLRQVAKPVATIDARLRTLADDMLETMYAAPGIGLAAPQIGIMQRLIVLDVTHARTPADAGDIADSNDIGDSNSNSIDNSAEIDKANNAVKTKRGGGHRGTDDAQAAATPPPYDPLVLINPRVISCSQELSIYEEGCLSIPEVYEDVARPAACVVTYKDLDGVEQTRACEGVLATCVQHEIDHLDGKLFIDYLSRLKRGRIEKRFQKQRRLERT